MKKMSKFSSQKAFFTSVCEVNSISLGLGTKDMIEYD